MEISKELEEKIINDSFTKDREMYHIHLVVKKSSKFYNELDNWSNYKGDSFNINQYRIDIAGLFGVHPVEGIEIQPNKIDYVFEWRYYNKDEFRYKRIQIMTKKEREAIKESIEHWEKDILEPCLYREQRGLEPVWVSGGGGHSQPSHFYEAFGGGERYVKWSDVGEKGDTLIDVPCHSDDCPLCKICYREWYADNRPAKLECIICPIAQQGHSGCSSKNSVWMKWMNNPNSETAQGMINLLKGLIKENNN